MISSTYTTNTGIIFCDYNRKSKEGSVVAFVTEDNKLHLINTDNLTLLRSISFNNDINLMIKENSTITALNFKLNDTVFLGYSDGSIIKVKFNEPPINLLYENSNKYLVSAEDEFENIKSVFSTDVINRRQNTNSNSNNLNTNNLQNIGQASSISNNKTNGKYNFQLLEIFFFLHLNLFNLFYFNFRFFKFCFIFKFINL